MEDQDLEQYLNEEAAAADAQPVAAEGPVRGFLTDAQRAATIQKYYDATMADQKTPSQLVDVEGRMAPQVDKDGNPINPFARNPLVGLGQALSQVSRSRNDVIQNAPNLRLGTKLAAAEKAGYAGALGGLADSVMDKKRSDAEAQLNADVKRAQMFRALHPKGGAAASYAGLINADQRERQIAENQARYEAKAKAQAEKADPNSEASKSYREAMYRAGAPAGTLDGLSLNDMAAARTFNMQTTRLDTQGSEKDRATQNELYAAEQKRRAQQATDIMDEERKRNAEQKGLEIPGLVWTKPATKDAYEKVIPLRAARRSLVDNSRRLEEIQNEMQKNWGLASAIGQSVGVFAADDRTKDLLAEADNLRREQVDAARVAYGYGAPQVYELTRLEQQYQRPGDVTPYLKGTSPYRAIAKTADAAIRDKMRLYGAVFPDDAAAYPKAEEPSVDSQVLKVDREFKPYQPRRGGAQGASESVPDVSEKLPTTASAGGKTQKYSVTVNGETVVREWTPEKLRTFLKGADDRAKKDPAFKFEVTGVK